MTKKEIYKEFKKVAEINFEDWAVRREIVRLSSILELQKESIEKLIQAINWYNGGETLQTITQMNDYNKGYSVAITDDIKVENNDERLLVTFQEISNKGLGNEKHNLIWIRLKKN